MLIFYNSCMNKFSTIYSKFQLFWKKINLNYNSIKQPYFSCKLITKKRLRFQTHPFEKHKVRKKLRGQFFSSFHLNITSMLALILDKHQIKLWSCLLTIWVLAKGCFWKRSCFCDQFAWKIRLFQWVVI